MRHFISPWTWNIGDLEWFIQSPGSLLTHWLCLPWRIFLQLDMCKTLGANGPTILPIFLFNHQGQEFWAMAKYHWKGRTKQNQFNYKTEEILRTSHDPRNLAAPRIRQAGGKHAYRKDEQGLLGCCSGSIQGLFSWPTPKKNNDTRIPLHSRSARALRLFIRLDSNRHSGMAAATLTSFSMSNLLQEKGVYLRVHGGVSSAGPEQRRQQARFFRMVDYSYKSSTRKMRKWLFCSHSFWHCEKLWKHHAKYNGWSSPETIFSRSSVGGIQQFPAICEGYIIYYIVLYSPRWHSALLVSFPSDLSTLVFLVSCIPMFIGLYRYIIYPFVWFMFLFSYSSIMFYPQAVDHDLIWLTLVVLKISFLSIPEMIPSDLTLVIFGLISWFISPYDSIWFISCEMKLRPTSAYTDAYKCCWYPHVGFIRWCSSRSPPSGTWQACLAGSLRRNYPWHLRHRRGGGWCLHCLKVWQC